MRTRDRLLVPALAALAFAAALLQRPGRASSDTKIDLHVDPVGFLAEVASAWSSTGDLGHVQGGQYGGYLFPMGPFFALGHLLGLAPWLVQRLWLGLLLALAVWGTVRLMDALAGPRGLPHVVAGLLVLLNPYVVVFSARTSVTLLGYSALPWLLLCAHRGLRGNRWRWAAAFALIVTASGGGVNAAVTAWVLAGPLLLVVYERWRGLPVWGFAWRTAVATAGASVWWVVPLLVQSRYGSDFLRFTEQPGTIWSTTSLPESLRLMGYWISYLGVGYGGTLRPYFGDGGVLLFSLPVVLAGLLVSGIALTGFARTRATAYGPFALLLVIAGLVIMVAGFPEGTPLRRALNFTYNHVLAVQFLRTTYKAGPLVALGVAILGGLLARRPRVAVALLGLALVACWPLVRGRALDSQLLWDRIPAAWTSAAGHVDEAGGRAVVLPGQLYAHYDWGGTIDPILPILADTPVATRNAVGYADPRATDLLWTLDALVQQRRALPGQLDGLLDLAGARTVIAGADDDRTRSGAAPAAEAADMLDALGPPDAAWGPVRAAPRAAGTLGSARPLPQVRAWDRPDAPGLVRIEPEHPGTIVDGSAEGLAALFATTSLDRAAGASGGAEGAGGGAFAGDGLAYAADVPIDTIAGAREVVITDSNRRRVLVPSRLAQNVGPTLAADEEPSVDAAVVNPFPDRGSDAQTVAVYDGIAGVSAPSSPGFPQFPERRPFAALDGDPATAWLADRALTEDRHALTVTFDRPRDIDVVRLLPYDDRRATVLAVEVGGKRFDVRRGWNELRVGLRAVRSLTVRIAAVRKPAGVTAGAGGIRELELPGVTAHEALRAPVLAERALAGQDVSRTAFTYLFMRTTGDDPFRRDPRRGSAGAGLVRDRLDGERSLARVLAPPAARSWTVDGWASAFAAAPDPALDALTGVRGEFASSGRFEGRPEFRASSAFDGSSRAWIGSWLDGRPAWLSWTATAHTTLTALTLDPVPGVRRATRVRISSESGAVEADVDGGRIRLPEPVSGRRFRLEILRAAFPPGTAGAVRQRRAVGIAELHGAGLPRVTVPRSGPLARGCDAISGTLGGRAVRLRAEGTIGDLDAGRPIRVAACEPIALPAGETRLELAPGALAPYLIRLRSAAPDAGPRGRVASADAPGRVSAQGHRTRGGWDGIRVALTAPGRLVLAESFNPGRRASCDGRDLGAPEVGAAFGTAWRVPASCRNVTVSFAPNRLVDLGYGFSALFCAVLLVGVFRLRSDSPTELEPPPGETVGALPLRTALAIALPAALVLGFVFAARATPVFAAGVAVVLWRGVGARALALAGGGLLTVAVPLLSVLIRPEDRGGYNPEYAIDGIAVHWVAVAGLVLLALSLSRAMGRPGRARSAPPSGAAPSERAP